MLLSILQSNERPEKHGGFSCLLTPIGSSGSWQLPLTNRDPTLEIKSFTPLVFAKNFNIIFEFRLKILIFLQSRKLCFSFKFLVYLQMKQFSRKDYYISCFQVRFTKVLFLLLFLNSSLPKLVLLGNCGPQF
jgi:hypothetical protein